MRVVRCGSRAILTSYILSLSLSFAQVCAVLFYDALAWPIFGDTEARCGRWRPTRLASRYDSDGFGGLSASLHRCDAGDAHCKNLGPALPSLTAIAKLPRPRAMSDPRRERRLQARIRLRRGRHNQEDERAVPAARALVADAPHFFATHSPGIHTF